MSKLPITERPCMGCGNPPPHTMRLREKGHHYADLNCTRCGIHLGFVPKPDSDPTKYRRQKQHRDLVAKYGRGFCEMCLRLESELPKGQTLEGQHVVEHQDGGSAERSNIWIVCTACHRFIHWVRTYHSNAFKAELVARTFMGVDDV